MLALRNSRNKRTPMAVGERKICSSGTSLFSVAFGHWAADPYTQHLHKKGNKMNKLFAYIFGPQGADKREIQMEIDRREEIESGFDENGVRAVEESGGDETYEKLHAQSLGAPFGPADDPPPFEPFPNRQVQSGRIFIWETNDGAKLPVTKMATPHLFYTLRMIYNHSVPPAFRVGDFKRRKNVDQWPLDYRVQAGREIRRELESRKDYELWMQFEVKDMLENEKFINSLAPSPPTINLRPFTEEEIRATIAKHGLDPDRYVPERVQRRSLAREKRMKRAVVTGLMGFPGKRCMEHRSYAGIRRPRVDCKACGQVYRARQLKRKAAHKIS
jgi:hypothetical protein